MNRTRISHFYCVLFPDLAPDDALFLEKTFQKQILKMYLKGSVSVCMCSERIGETKREWIWQSSKCYFIHRICEFLPVLLLKNRFEPGFIWGKGGD